MAVTAPAHKDGRWARRRAEPARPPPGARRARRARPGPGRAPSSRRSRAWARSRTGSWYVLDPTDVGATLVKLRDKRPAVFHLPPTRIACLLEWSQHRAVGPAPASPARAPRPWARRVPRAAPRGVGRAVRPPRGASGRGHGAAYARWGGGGWGREAGAGRAGPGPGRRVGRGPEHGAACPPVGHGPGRSAGSVQGDRAARPGEGSTGERPSRAARACVRACARGARSRGARAGNGPGHSKSGGGEAARACGARRRGRRGAFVVEYG